MLFSYTLIFFLFTTFVAAAPVNRPILADKEFFTGNGGDTGEWYPTLPEVFPKRTHIRWWDSPKGLLLQLDSEERQSQWIPLELEEEPPKFPPAVIATLCAPRNKWKHSITGSTIKFSEASDGVHLHLEVVDRGKWKGVIPTVSDV